MFRLLIVAPAILLSGQVFAGENCTCRYQGAEIFEGQTACIRTPNGLKMAKCERVLNNTSWKFLDQPCPSAQLSFPNPNMSVETPETRETIFKPG